MAGYSGLTALFLLKGYSDDRNLGVKITLVISYLWSNSLYYAMVLQIDGRRSSSKTKS
jgi:hypothetical protein